MSVKVVLNARPPLTSSPLVAAHRGARGHAPENTLAAAALAASQGADLWELDVNYTKDFQLVIVHDDTLTRTTNVTQVYPGRPSYRVCDFSLAELQRLDAGTWFGATDPFGTVKSGEVSLDQLTDFAGDPIPTLEEALRFTADHNWAVNVEIKDHAHLIGHNSVTEAVIDLILTLDVAELVLLSSFQHDYLRQSKKLFPELPTGALVEDVRPENPVALCCELGVAAYHPDRILLAEGDLAALRDAGFAVNVWTVNDLDEMQQLVKDGATGIITDFPSDCLMVLGRTGGGKPF